MTTLDGTMPKVGLPLYGEGKPRVSERNHNFWKFPYSQRHAQTRQQMRGGVWDRHIVESSAIRGQALAQTRARHDPTNFRLAVRGSNQNCACPELSELPPHFDVLEELIRIRFSCSYDRDRLIRDWGACADSCDKVKS